MVGTTTLPSFSRPILPTDRVCKMATESDVLSEIEVLQSIYLDDLRITQRDDEGWEVSLVLYPSTGEDSLSQFVRLTLTLVLNSQYPSTPPTISIHNPRGLSDDKLLSVERCLQMEAESCVGMPVLYQLIERAKEILTESNIPHGNCVICLYGFKEGEVFTKTSCYHYFHSHCLGRYITHSERELREREKEMEEDKTREWAEELNVVCPVCREALTYDVNVLLSSPPPSFPKLKDGVIGAEFRQKWAELQRVLDRQREKGGIIDPEAESKRFLIHINEPQPDTSDVPETELDASQTLPCPPPNSASQIPVSQSQHVSGRSQYRAGYGRSQHGGFKGGRKGRGRQVPFEKTRPVTDNLAKLDLSSDKCQEVKNLSVGQEHAETESSPEGDALESKLGQAGTDGEQPINIRHLETSMSTDGQQTKQSKTAISKTGGQTDSMREKPSRDRPDRGQRRDPRGSGQPRQFQERNFCGSYHWDSSGGVYNHRGGRGHRVRGGRPGYSHFRGSGAHRGGGRGFHQKVEGEVERGLL